MIADPSARLPPLRAGDAWVRYVDEGDGPPVVLVHGWALDLDQFRLQAAALRDRWRVIRFDRVGFGASTGTPAVDADVLAIGALLDHLRLASAALVAASQAGRAVLRFALEHPSRVNALVLDGVPLEGSLPGPNAEDAAPVDALARVLQDRGVGAVRELLAQHAFFRLQTPDPRARELLATMLRRYPAADLMPGAPPSTPGPNVAARLAELTMPVLVVNGEFDTRHRRLTGEALAYGLPNARREIVAGAGHLANLDRPAQYAGMLHDFLTTTLASIPENRS